MLQWEKKNNCFVVCFPGAALVVGPRLRGLLWILEKVFTVFTGMSNVFQYNWNQYLDLFFYYKCLGCSWILILKMQYKYTVVGSGSVTRIFFSMYYDNLSMLTLWLTVSIVIAL